MAERVVDARDLSVRYGEIPVLSGISLYVDEGESVAIIGESGSGKSTILLSLLGSLGENARVTEGSIERKTDPVMIFQGIEESLDPVIKIGRQLVWLLQSRRKISRSESVSIIAKALSEVGLDARAVMDCYPFELSGGMLQRTMIAIAAASESSLILADEPTSSLDPLTGREILRLLMNEAQGKRSLLLVTHDLEAASRCDRIYVVYAGIVVETGPASLVIENPLHPYTAALLASIPPEDGSLPLPIKGSPPSFGTVPRGCPFMPRCSNAKDECNVCPALSYIGEGRYTRCYG